MRIIRLVALVLGSLTGLYMWNYLPHWVCFLLLGLVLASLVIADLSDLFNFRARHRGRRPSRGWKLR